MAAARSVTTAIAAVAGLLLLASCTWAPVNRPSDETPNAGIGVPDTRIRQSTIVKPPEGVVATGAFVSGDPTIGGSIAITSDGSDFFVDLSQAELSGMEHPLIGLADAVLAVGDCLGESAQATMENTEELPFLHGGFEGDPSFFSTAVIVEYDSATADCNRRIIAAAPLVWTMPDLRPDLVVTDRGESAGANGVLDAANGRPHTYATAAGDNLEAIATRFGITIDELNWLNPCRPGVYTRSEAYAGEVLNLDKALRGARLPQLA